MRNSSAYNIIQKILDFIFPPSDRTLLIRDTTPADLPRLTRGRQPEDQDITAVCDYRHERVRDVVYACKFAGTHAASELIGECMQQELLGICQEERIFAENIIITPIPLSKKKRRERGFNQSERICDEIIRCDENTNFQKQNLLKKVKETADQAELSRTERRKNVSRTFSACNNGIDTEVIFVIDDVVTTGATLKEARRALKEVTDARIIGIAFAH